MTIIVEKMNHVTLRNNKFGMSLNFGKLPCIFQEKSDNIHVVLYISVVYSNTTASFAANRF